MVYVVYMCVCVCVCICVYAYVCLSIYVFTYICMCLYVCVCGTSYFLMILLAGGREQNLEASCHNQVALLATVEYFRLDYL